MPLSDRFGASALYDDEESTDSNNDISTTSLESDGFSDISAGFGQSALYGGDIADGLGQDALYSDETNDAAESTDNLSRAAISIRSAVEDIDPSQVVENATSNESSNGNSQSVIPIPMPSGQDGVGLPTMAVAVAFVGLLGVLLGQDNGDDN